MGNNILGRQDTTAFSKRTLKTSQHFTPFFTPQLNTQKAIPAPLPLYDSKFSLQKTNQATRYRNRPARFNHEALLSPKATKANLETTLIIAPNSDVLKVHVFWSPDYRPYGRNTDQKSWWGSKLRAPTPPQRSGNDQMRQWVQDMTCFVELWSLSCGALHFNSLKNSSVCLLLSRPPFQWVWAGGGGG